MKPITGMVLKQTPLWGGILEKTGSVESFVLFCLALLSQETEGGSPHLWRLASFLSCGAAQVTSKVVPGV